jgi:hypothetical protein
MMGKLLATLQFVILSEERSEESPGNTTLLRFWGLLRRFFGFASE